jgi:predicted lipid-binding transport protein (Tim44 family)
LRPDPITHPVLTIAPEAAPGLEKITASDLQFNPAAFGDFAGRVIFDLHEAWSRQNLEHLEDRVTREFLDFLRLGLETLSLQGQISYLEELLLTRMVAVEAGVKGERAFITVWFQGQVVDYILDRPSRRLLSGSMTYPAELNEYWRFERRRDRGVWQLADIKST